MQFEFATAGKVVFGPGSFEKAGAIGRELGEKTLLVCGKRRERADQLAALLSGSGVASVLFHVPSEPTVSLVCEGVKVLRDGQCDCVIGVGGGSVIDAGKVIAALASNPGDVFDFLEVVGKGKPLAHSPLPYLAIPTTAGTGAEATRNAVLLSEEHRQKVSLRSPLMLPRAAIVDPLLTRDLPPDLTAATGMDALTQLIEPFVSVRANPMTDALCGDGIRRAARSLAKAVETGSDEEARNDMALASLYGGMALANAGLGAVHGFAGPIGGMFPAPHGAVCARLLPLVMEVNLRALRQRQSGGPLIERFEEVAYLLTGNDSATAEDGSIWVSQLCARIGIPPLRKYKITREDLPAIIEKARTASSMKGNPVKLTPLELGEILERAY